MSASKPLVIAVNFSWCDIDHYTLCANPPVYFTKKGMCSFSMSSGDALDKDEWRLGIKKATG